MTVKLGVNIDHVATVRQARGVCYPDPVEAARVAEASGADQITVHIRMDRRHIQDADLFALKEVVTTRLNVEMATSDEMMEIAGRLLPAQVTLVPERPGEITTEGGLDLRDPTTFDLTVSAVASLLDLKIKVAIFADPDPAQVDAVVAVGATIIEFNTAAYAEVAEPSDRLKQLERLTAAARYAKARGLFVAAGHGLHFENVQELVKLDLFREFNIGHSLIARSIFSGLAAAVRDMKTLLSDGQSS
jgi:pyridoxine 5-phosphate synthase